MRAMTSPSLRTSFTPARLSGCRWCAVKDGKLDEKLRSRRWCCHYVDTPIDGLICAATTG